MKVKKDGDSITVFHVRRPLKITMVNDVVCFDASHYDYFLNKEDMNDLISYLQDLESRMLPPVKK